MVRVFVACTHHDPEAANDLTGLNFEIEFDPEGKAQVSIPEMQPVLFQEPYAAYCVVLERLGRAMLEAAHNPGLITQSLQGRTSRLGE